MELIKRGGHRIPPLNPLRFFEVVARTQNLTLAAQELCVTQSAVSRQIAVLEAYLGVELFRRGRHGVSLTPIGKAYAEQVIPSFHNISAATARLLASSHGGMLRVRTYTTFASQWLIPRLPDFRSLHPDIDVDIVTGMRDVDFERDAVDLAIQAGVGDWTSARHDMLFYDRIDPVCSPAYLNTHAQGGDDLPALLRGRLLYSRYSHSHSDWEAWLDRNAMTTGTSASEWTGFSISMLAWQSAAAGLGVAMGQIAMLNEEFKLGNLLRPFNKPVRRDHAYYLLRPKQRTDLTKVKVFREWLLKCAAQTRADLDATD